MASSPSSQQIAISLSLQNVGNVIDGINAITNAWAVQGRRVTKNMLEMQRLQNENIKVMADVAKASMAMGNQVNKTTGYVGGVLSGMVMGWVNGMTGAINQVAGKFKWLGGVVAGVGSIIGAALGGPVGLAIGGALGGLIGTSLGAFLDIPFKLIGMIGKAASTVVSAIGSIGKALTMLVLGPLSLFGIDTLSLFDNIKQGIKSTIEEIANASVEFQKLRISIETLTKREIARQENISIMEVSNERVLAQTQELFNWMTEVSLTSPFTMKSIAQSMKFASAMGLSIETTENLVLATGEFAAAMGLSEDHQERIMYNLAQIYQQGKLTGREFRDLAISFVPVYDILGEMAAEAGTTTEAFKKLALEGGVPVEDFFEHFINYMNTNFEGAMKRMARTMEGVKNNIKDFIQVVIGMELLGPTMNEISGRLATVLDKLLSKKTHQLAREFGEGLRRGFVAAATAADELGAAISRLLNALGFTVPTVDDFARAWVKVYLNMKWAIMFMAKVVDTITFGITKYIMPAVRSLSTAGEDSGSWGANIMANFAKGLVRGFATYVARALVYIRAIIVGFFKAHSPPLVAPGIDRMGGDLINEWITGMIERPNWGRIREEVGGRIAGIFQPVHDWDEGEGGIPAGPGEITQPADVPLPRGGAVIYDEQVGIINRTGRAVQNAVQNVANTTAQAVAQFIPFVTEQGLKLAAAFMHGFAEADFDILDNVQGQFKSIIDAFEGLGMIEEGKGFQLFYDFSQDLIASIDEFNKSGEISASLLEQISELGMGLGPELADLVQKEFALSTAIKAAEEAQIRLNRAIEALDQARMNVRKLIREYNTMLRGGADKNALKAQLARINAGERIVDQATKEKFAAEENKKIADEQLDRAKELVSLQERLMDNMIELLGTQVEAMASFERSAGGAAGAFEEMENAIIGAGGALGDAFEEPLIDWEGLEADLEPQIQKFWEELMVIWGDTFTTEMENVDTWNAARAFVSNLKAAIVDVLGMPKESLLEQAPALVMPGGQILQEHTVLPGGGKSFFQQIVDQIFSGNVNWGDAAKKITTIFVGVFTEVLDKVVTSLTTDGTLLNVGVQIGIGVAKGIGQGISDWLTGDWEPPSTKKYTITGDGFEPIEIEDNFWENFDPTPGTILDFEFPVTPRPRFDEEGIPTGQDIFWDSVDSWMRSKTENIQPIFSSIPLAPHPFIAEAEGTTFLEKLGNAITTAIDSFDAPIPIAPGGSLITSIFGGVNTAIEGMGGEQDIGAAVAAKAEEQITSESNVQTWLDSISSTVNKMLDYIPDPLIPDWFGLNDIGEDIASESDTQITSEPNKKTWKDAAKETVNEMLTNVLDVVLPDWFFTNDFGGKIASEANSQITSTTTQTSFLAVATNIVSSIGQGLLNGVAWLGSQINQLIQNAIAWYLDKFSNSPIEVFYDLGGIMADSIADGIINGVGSIEKGIAKIANPYDMLERIANPTAWTKKRAMGIPRGRIMNAPAVGSVTNVTFGDVYIRDNMDWATFKAMVRKVIVEG